MSTYTITTTDDEDAAIAFAAGDPEVDKQDYLEACVHGSLIDPWTRNYQHASAHADPTEITMAYLDASTQQQAEVAAILDVPAREAPAQQPQEPAQ